MASKILYTSRIERMLMRDRAIVLVALSVVIVASWLCVLAGAGTGMSTWNMTSWKMALGLSRSVTVPVEWTATYATVMFFMWWIMMIAMMLPSAAPMILLHAKVTRTTAIENQQPNLLPTVSFISGYLLAWTIFSAIATALQWLFEGIGVLSPMMMNSTNQLFAGLLLLLVGVYQLTPLKQACLKHCRSPIAFLSRQWRPGARGAFHMGLNHGTYCLGCCWGLMAVLFFGGIMNLYWIIGLAIIVLLEKFSPLGAALSYMTGSLLTVWGMSLLLGALS